MENNLLQPKKQGRGRPKKIKTQEEILAELLRPKRMRGRPKKIRTPEEIAAAIMKEGRGRGRPKKQRTPEEIALMNQPKRPRGRPKKIVLTHEEMLLQVMEPEVVKSEIINEQPKRKRGRPKNIKTELSQKLSPKILEENFVFPVYGLENKKNKKEKFILSPHLLDLKNKNTEIFNYPEFDEHNWFKNVDYAQPETPNQKEDLVEEIIREVNFESPNPDELIEKIRFNKPPKIKNKSSVKLNFGHEFLAKSEPVKIKSNPSLIIKFLKPFFKIITAPFKALDFIVDRTLKVMWWLIKSALLSILYLFKSTFKTLNTLLNFKSKATPAEVRVTPTKIKLGRKNLKPIFSFIIICCLIVLPFQFLSWKQKANNLQTQVLGKSIQGFEYLKNASVESSDLNFIDAEKNFNSAYFNFKLAETYLDNLDIVSQQIIKIIPQTAQAENLLIIGQLSSRLGEDLSILVNSLQTNDLNLITKLETAQQTLQTIEPYFLELIDKTQKINISQLPMSVDKESKNKLILFQTYLPALQNNLDNFKILTEFLLDFLGQGSSKKYLIIFQNNSELRPTGGFMGSYALIEIKDGKIINMQVPGGGFYDLKAATQTLVEAPKPFHLFSPYWQIWNANWFPDWPTSAEKISWFYEKSLDGITVDGVLSLTPDVIEDLLKIIGPIELPEYQKIITTENFVNEIQMAVEIEYDQEKNKPKQIIADLMPIILNKIFNLNIKSSPNFLKLLTTNLQEKNILFWFNTAQMQKVVENFNWGGKIKNAFQDYLMVVHTNIGGGKTDRVINNQIFHTLDVDEDGNAIATVKLTREHTGQIGKIFEDQNNVDYIRFYVPQGSTLISAEGFDFLPNNLFKTATNYETLKKDSILTTIEQNPVLDESSNTRITEEFGKTCFGNWLQTNTGKTREVTLKYRLPFKFKMAQPNLFEKIINFIKSKSTKNFVYNLSIQKQPGVAETQIISRLNLSTNFEIINSDSKNPLSQIGNQIIYQDDLRTDGYYEIEMK